ncbi:MAG: tetrahydromethanopterin S-methyltransferase subunit H [Ralstonia sp.]|jgi:hypothetical protein|uniref:Uncharacterized protein n=3 Tax=Burkholderiaceae TaxID=119060 RepID=A0ABM9IVI7_RALPI|nr:tetrahydromethanopterin S-methyltransferase subunit H [Ralstonia sp.]MBA4238520.1 tetrahydromethanopterin S-methyltransferase subunit H [Ralstonia sp.]MBA4404480.1 tetrahydromethanopterin S-methyltransferase subunit H [Ralstonia sp.]POH87429.1 hypothetical protein CJ026_011280 [Ralstonia pickettii]CAJ0732828.1 hypothetical protein R38712_05105 [Ralstonia pickettii]
MAEISLMEQPATVMQGDMPICHIPISPTLVVSMYRDASDNGIVWVWLVDLETSFLMDAAVPLADLDQFVSALVGRYSCETVLM